MAIMMHDQPLRRRALDFKNLEAGTGFFFIHIVNLGRRALDFKNLEAGLPSFPATSFAPGRRALDFKNLEADQNFAWKPITRTVAELLISKTLRRRRHDG